MHVKVFYIHKNGLQKKLIIEKNSFFAVDCVKIIEFYIAHIWRHFQTDWNALDQFGITMLYSATYFLEVGARISLKVTTKGSLRGKKNSKNRAFKVALLKQKQRGATKKFEDFLKYLALLYLVQLHIFRK